MKSEWPTIRLGQVATQYINRFDLQAEEMYSNLGVKWYAEGVFARDPKPGSQIKAKSLYRVKPGQFIYNRMFATEGSFGLVLDEHAEGVVSSEFPVFDLDQEQLLPKFLSIHFQQPAVWERVAQECVGTTKSRSRWKEERFLACRISLPPLDEQQRIVDLLERLEEATQAVNCKAERAREVLCALQSDAPEGVPRTVGQVLAGIDNGVTTKSSEQGEGLLKQRLVKASAVMPALFLAEESKPVGDMALPESTRVHDGDLLMTRINTPERVGHICIAVDVPENLFRPDLVWRLRVNEDIVRADYFEHRLSSPEYRKIVAAAASGTSRSMQQISKGRFSAIKLDVPALEDQREYAATCDAARAVERGLVKRASALRSLRVQVTSALLSGAHRIPESYDELMGA